MEKLKKQWWKKAVVYEIYPKSFYDSDGDGLGDLRGIIRKLDYLEELGVNVLWLCPVYKSPMADNGYDVADYYQVDPSYGTNEDLEELIGEAGKRGIRIVMDMVVNHCSDEHEWFQRALKDPEGRYGKYFYIRKGADGGPPNNWRSVFGGSAWEPVPGTPYYYLHTFTKKQADLNWENRELREEIYKMMNWWMDRGVAGFRLDAITYLKKKDGLPSFAPDGEDGLVTCSYGSLNCEGIREILRELRDRTYGPRCALAVGEAPGVAPEDALEYISLEDGLFSMIFEFAEWEIALKGPDNFWYDERDWTQEDVKREIFNSHRAVGEKGWYGVFLENHDQSRSIDHYLPEEGRNYYGASMLAAVYMFRRGTPFLYQGEEIGMRGVRWPSIGDYDDCSSHNQYELARRKGLSHEEAMECIYKYSRDNARTPFQWEDAPNGGFTSGRPWLRVNENYTEINARGQRQDPDSLYHWYQKLIRLRLCSEYSDILTDGSFVPLYEDVRNLLAYERSYQGRRVQVFCNYQQEECRIRTAGDLCLMADNYGDIRKEGDVLTLRAFEALIAEAAERPSGGSEAENDPA